MYLFFKRLFDIVSSGIALLILTPLFIPLMIALKLTGEGYIFYAQRRLGYRNKYFNILKFATMLKDSPNIGTGLITLRNDPRLTPLGGFLRMSKINELPQLFNVLMGQMSVVGPRPLVDKTFQTYPDELRDKVYLSKPGLTGIGSVIFRDEEGLYGKIDLPPDELYRQVIGPYKASLEVWYLHNRSTYVDFMIIFLTAWVIIFPESKLPHRIFPTLPKQEQFLPKLSVNAPAHYISG